MTPSPAPPAGEQLLSALSRETAASTPRDTQPPTRRSARRAVVTAASVAALAVCGGADAAAQPAGPLRISQCPALYVLAVDGTGQSSPGASPAAATPVLGAMVEPLLTAGPAAVQRAYVPYDAAFGGVPGTGGTTAPYAVSVQAATSKVGAMASQISAACPGTRIAGVGFSQGAHAMSQFAASVGSGAGPVRPDQVAGVALISDPARTARSPVLPGRPGSTTPAPAPGTSGAAVAGVRLPASSAAGGGIDTSPSRFGSLTGRVATLCTQGDLACSVPAQAPLLRAGAGIAAQGSVADPAATVARAGAAVAAVATGVLANDVTVAGGNVNYAPQQTLSQRAVDAASPRIPAPGPHQQAQAAQNWSRASAAVAADPVGQLPRLVQQAAAAVGAAAAENQALLDPRTWAAAHAQHSSYGPALAASGAWFAALAADLTHRPR